MRLVVQRVSQARVSVEKETVGQINRGMLVYVGVEKNDGEREVNFMVDKIVNLRIFPDAGGKMNLNLAEVGGSRAVDFPVYPGFSYQEGKKAGLQQCRGPGPGRIIVPDFQ
jgi:D-tyrosyl-tRNA(Tyr) deacylase